MQVFTGSLPSRSLKGLLPFVFFSFSPHVLATSFGCLCKACSQELTTEIKALRHARSYRKWTIQVCVLFIWIDSSCKFRYRYMWDLLYCLVFLKLRNTNCSFIHCVFIGYLNRTFSWTELEHRCLLLGCVETAILNRFNCPQTYSIDAHKGKPKLWILGQEISDIRCYIAPHWGAKIGSCNHTFALFLKWMVLWKRDPFRNESENSYLVEDDCAESDSVLIYSLSLFTPHFSQMQSQMLGNRKIRSCIKVPKISFY